jgi:hypothetical protein
MNSLEAAEIMDRVRKVDWYYNYSDDYSVWKAGEQSMKDIKQFASSREWSIDDVETLKLAVRNAANLQNFRTEEGHKRFVKGWYEKIDHLFTAKEANE